MATAQDLYHSTALVEAVKSLAPSNVKGHGKVYIYVLVPYQKPRLKSMTHGDMVYSVMYYEMHGANST